MDFDFYTCHVWKKGKCTIKDITELTPDELEHFLWKLCDRSDLDWLCRYLIARCRELKEKIKDIKDVDV